MTYIAPARTAADVATEVSRTMGIDLRGAPDTRVAGVATWAAMVAESLSYFALERAQTAVTPVERTVICTPKNCHDAAAAAVIVVADPRAAFMHVLERLLYDSAIDIATTVAAQAQNVKPGRFDAHATAIVEEPAIIGSGAYLDANAIVKAGSIIGPGVYVGAGAIIGASGRAVHKCADGKVLSWRNLHVGTTYIGEGSEIGAHVVVNRAMLGQTKIGKRAQVGNLVHIGHGASLADGVWLGSHSTILGHVTIGNGATVGAHAVIRDNIDIGANAAIAMGSVVAANVEAGQSVLGNPAKPTARQLQPGPAR
jgi:UDP-3-O-[3-hydroxymyristoyl] glucosamine N-acyltransferase